MNISKQKCLDGKTLMIGQGLLNLDVLNAVKQVINMTYTDEVDIICIQNCIDNWDDMTTQDQELVYCIVSNVYSVLVEDVNTFLDDCFFDGVNISYCKDTNTFIPTAINTNTLKNTLVKI